MPSRSKKLTPELIAKWNEKLKKSGFVDIEDSKGDLKKFTKTTFMRRLEGPKEDNNGEEWTKLRFESEERYYQLAGQFLHSHKFDSEKEKAIWEEHSNGYPYREIESRLKKRRFKVYKDLINLTVMKLRKVMLSNGQD